MAGNLVVLVLGAFAICSVYVEAPEDFDWTGIRADIRDSLPDANTLHGRFVGIGGRTVRQWYRQQWVKQHIAPEEAKKLLGHPRGAVKALAAESLLLTQRSEAYELLKMAGSDTLSVFFYVSGCVGRPMLLGEYLLMHVEPFVDGLPPPSEKRIRLSLSAKEARALGLLYSTLLERREAHLDRLLKQ